MSLSRALFSANLAAADSPVKPPVLPRRLGEQVVVSARRHAIDAVVGAHDAAGVAVLHAALERRVVRVLQILCRHLKKEIEKGFCISFQCPRTAWTDRQTDLPAKALESSAVVGTSPWRRRRIV